MAKLRLPFVLHVRRENVVRGDALLHLVSRTFRLRDATLLAAWHAFAFKNDEHAFARELLSRKSNLWLFRTNQRAFAGDFVVVDLSSPSPAGRCASVLDLKRGAPLRIGGGGAGIQLKNASLAIRELAARGTLAEGVPCELLTGDARFVLRHLGVA
jgi:hypothetical protein